MLIFVYCNYRRYVSCLIFFLFLYFFIYLSCGLCLGLEFDEIIAPKRLVVPKLNRALVCFSKEQESFMRLGFFFFCFGRVEEGGGK